MTKTKSASEESVNAPIWKVTRFCCRSGMCIDCKQRGNLYGDTSKRKRVMHADKLTKARADEMTSNWREFDARTELM
jgi:hypothetical protein